LVSGKDHFTTVTTVDPSVYADPQLLFQAPVMLTPSTLDQLGQLQQTHGFHFAGSYRFNTLNLNEKWFQDRNGNWYVLTTDGQIRRWQHGSLSTQVVATVDLLVWDLPDLLFQA
jgi:hypothetical protein